MLVLTSPSGTTRRERMSPLAAGTDRWEAGVLLDERGVWHWHVTGFDDEVATWRHDAALKVDAGVDAELMFEIGARLLDRAVAEKSRPLAARRRLTVLAAALRDGAASVAHRRPLIDDPALEEFGPRPLAASLDRLPRARDPRRAAPRRRGFLVRVLPPLRGCTEAEGRQVEERHVPHRHATTRRRRRDGLRRRLPATDPPDRRHQPQGPQQHARSGSARPRLAMGDRRQARRRNRRRPRRGAPRPRQPRRLPRLRAPRGGARHRDRARPRAPGLPRPSVGVAASRLVHATPRRHHSPCREPAEEVPGHLPGQLRRRPRGHLRRGAPPRAALGEAGRAGSSASTTRTPSRCNSGSGSSRP